MTNAEVVANDVRCLERWSGGLTQEVEVLSELLELAYEWTCPDKLDLAILLAQRAVEVIASDVKEIRGMVETLKKYGALPPAAVADLSDGAEGGAS